MADDLHKNMRDKLIGFGEASVRKSYYPQLRKRLEELELFLALLDRANDLVFLADSQTGLVRNANLTACSRLGLDKAQLEGRPFLDLFVLDREENFQPLDDKALDRFGVYDVRLAEPRAANAVFELTLSAVTVASKRYAVAVARDITQRKADQLALRRSEERFRAIFNSVSELIFVHDVPSGAILEVNRNVTDLLGYTASECRAMDVGMLSLGEPPYDQAGAMRLMRAAMQGAPQVAHWRARTKDGRLIWMEMSLRLAVLAEKPRLLVSARDIDARKVAEEELGRTRIALQSILDSMPSAVAGVDRRRRVTFWNRAAATLTGVNERQARGRPLEDVLPLPEGCDRLLEETLALGRTCSRSTVRSVDDQPRYNEWQAFPLQGPNGVDGAVVRLDDVTERVRMQEAMLQAEKMMSVGGLAAGMAHEINNPLAGILQSLQNMERRLLGDLPGNRASAERNGLSLASLRGYLEDREIPSLVETIRQSGERAAKIVANMLSFSRPGSSAHVPVDLAQMVDKAIEIASSDYNLTKKYDFRRIRIVRDYQADMPRVPCSQNEMQQVMLNLLLNAAQALFRFQEVAEPTITVTMRADETRATIEVRDNGPGMDETLRRRAFEPFVTTKRPGEGTGLGLSVSYFIVTRNHQGRFQVFSEPGKGARFEVSLPLRPDSGQGPS